MFTKRTVFLSALVSVLLVGLWNASDLAGKTATSDTKIRVCHIEPDQNFDEADTKVLTFELGEEEMTLELQPVNETDRCGFLVENLLPANGEEKELVFGTDGMETLTGGLLIYDGERITMSLVKGKGKNETVTSVFQAYPRVNEQYSGTGRIRTEDGEPLIY